MKIEFYRTDLGIVVKHHEIRLKSTYENKVILTQEQFDDANPVQIKKGTYLEELNTWFRNSKFKWVHQGTKFKKAANFEYVGNGIVNYDFNKDIPKHGREDGFSPYCFIVLYHGRIYYTFISGNYFPQMQLMDFGTKKLTGKWTHIKNLAPVFNMDTKQII